MANKKMTKKTMTGAENVRWDLGFLYSGVDDPQIDRDVAQWVALAKKFHATHKGNLAQTLGQALRDQAEMAKLGEKIGYYPMFRLTLDTDDGPVKAKKTEVSRVMSEVSGNYLEFFTLEAAALSDEQLAVLYERDAEVARCRSMIEMIRIFKPHQLSEEVESALTKRLEFGSGAWSEFFDEVESDLRFTHNDKQLKLEEIMHELTESKDADERATVMKIINDGLKKDFAKYSAQTLNMVVGEKAVEDRERGYKHPMEGRNKGSRIPDAVVEVLHKAVVDVGGPLARRFYRLKGAHLGIEKMRWSDRNAPMPFADTSAVPWDAAIKMVIEAYESFSPTLADLVHGFIEKKWIDAPVTPSKAGGAYNASGYLPGGPFALTMLNYLGSSRDVMVVAHELGHGVHGMLAGEAQGPLMMRPPMAYCETASVFAEMVTFNNLKAERAKSGDTKQMLALVMGKLDDIINTTVRQIGFSNFERRIHAFDSATMSRGETKHLAVADLDRIWLETAQELYGKPGDVFTYENTEHLWAYVGHFHRPFYVYAYAFGELLTHSLYAKRAEFGDRFEPLYLELLRSGNTKDVVELLKPFGLDPTDPKFWQSGIEVSIGALLKEAEELSAEIGVKV
ncbi:MAG: M3 family oligoendopeptidase [Patescibacteria group bacterium]|nr:M3 family oligoendopeptidase [Patescibacteria group bacterium]